jgi:hypothetical protein
MGIWLTRNDMDQALANLILSSCLVGAGIEFPTERLSEEFSGHSS